MKAVLIFNEATEIAFYSVDDEFTTHLLRRLHVMGAMKNEQSYSENHDLREALMSFFAPLVTSFMILNSFKKPIISICTDENSVIVFKKFGDHIYVAMNGNESEEVLVRKLHALNRIIGLLYGPVVTKISSPNVQQRAIEWKTLSSLLSTYEMLYNNEQAFLMEAVEHIAFGQLNAAQNVCIQLAEDCLNHTQNGGIHNTKHVLLLVGSKILAICGRSPQLPTADLLLLILLTSNIYQQDNSSGLLKDDNIVKASTDDKMVEGITPYQTPTVSPVIENNVAVGGHEIDKDEYKTPDEEVSMTKGIGLRIRQLMGRRGEKSITPTAVDEENLTAALSKFYEKRVFLQLSQGHFIPHTVHCLEIYPQIILVLVTEVSSNLASSICQTISLLKQSFKNTPQGRANVRAFYEVIDDSIKRIVDSSRILVTSSDSDLLKNCILKVHGYWIKCKELHFVSFIEKQLKEEVDITRITNQIENLIESLVSLYDELYLSPQVTDIDKKNVVSKLMRLSHKLRIDYGDYLSVKVTFNLPFPGFGISYPGMVHFAFVDRSFDELTSPTILEESITSSYVIERAKLQGQTPGKFLRSKVWYMVQRSQNYISNGYTSQTWLDGDFLCTYCMWISTLNPNLGIPLKMVTPMNIKGTSDEPPGVLCGSFYKDIKGNSDGPAYVNEIYCIHEPHMSLNDAITQCKNLALSLWLLTKQSLAPFPLIN